MDILPVRMFLHLSSEFCVFDPPIFIARRRIDKLFQFCDPLSRFEKLFYFNMRLFMKRCLQTIACIFIGSATPVLSATTNSSLASEPGVSCTHSKTGETLDFSCEDGKGTVWFNDEVYEDLSCNRIPEGRRYIGTIGSESDEIYLKFGLSSYGQRVHGHLFDRELYTLYWDYCTVN